MSAKVLCHVTHRSRWREIVHRDGLLPKLARGVKKVVWLADRRRLPWALRHVAKSHGWPADELIVIRLRIDSRELVRTGRPGVFNVRSAVPADTFEAINL